MAEYIEREEALNELCMRSEATFSLTGKPILDVNYVEAIKAVPAADVRPVVRAKWSCKRTNEHDGDWYCTACNKELTIYMGNREDRYAFCPYCGALMENGNG